MDSHLYKIFEDTYRGSTESIDARLAAYDGLLKPLANLYPGGRLLDLGCGRGEWMRYAARFGFEVHGVDLNEQMLEQARADNLKVTHGDAIEALKQQADHSLACVSAFHLVEHIPFEVLTELVRHARRVLAPGGLLVMETPNPENIAVGTNTFYIDPTHQRPIPPELLSFLPQPLGFARTVILRLNQENPQIASSDSISLTDVLYGASRDYAVIAQTPAQGPVTEQAMAQFDQAFLAGQGIATRHLSLRFDSQMLSLKAQVNHLYESLHHEHARARLYQLRYEENSKRLEEIYSSSSWRLSKPIRALGYIRARLPQIKGTIKSGLRRFLIPIAIWLQRHPRVWQAILAAVPASMIDKLRAGKSDQSQANPLDEALDARGLTSLRDKQVFEDLNNAIDNPESTRSEHGPH